jgi:hypothetical protein
MLRFWRRPDAFRIEIAPPPDEQAARLRSVRGLGDGAWLPVVIITLTGVAGFVGLLVASHYDPPHATPLRIGALIWFFGFGVVRSFQLSRRR